MECVLLPSPVCKVMDIWHLKSCPALSLLSGGEARGNLGAAGGLQEPLAKGHMVEDSDLIWVTVSIQELKKLSDLW